MSAGLVSALPWLAVAAHALASATLALFGLHSAWLLWRLHRGRGGPAQPEGPAALATPAVLVQLPVFNERDVVERLVAAAGELDWPADRLRIQLLDDGTDDSVELGARAIARLRGRGLQAAQVRRPAREGFKAGALAHGLAVDAAHPEGPAAHVAIFDADFVPPPAFLRRAVPYLQADPELAFVQGRWEHLNAAESLLTRAQALGTDGHFAIEQAARAWSGLALNFNGSCGIWRRAAIEAAGGWQGDTLTEDLDLSYRAQLAGWRAEYLLDLAVPGELPGTPEAWRAQQFRWAKGSLQTARKLLPRVWTSGWGLERKLAATLHLTHYLVHPLILLGLLLAPFVVPVLGRLPPGLRWLGGVLVVCGVLPPIVLYATAQSVLGRRRSRLMALPILAALGTGLAVSNARAAWEALRGVASPFQRTPKRGQGHGSYRSMPASGLAELLAAAWGGIGLLVAARGAGAWLVPVLALYTAGFALQGAWLLARRLREAASRSAGPARAGGWLLVPLGCAALALMGLLASRDTSWREEPRLFAWAGTGLGAVCLAALAVVRRRPPRGALLAWIVAVGVALNLLGTGLWHSDDVHRYVLEGELILGGRNPYVEAPEAFRDIQLPGGAEVGRINHPELTAIYPPGALLAHAAIEALWPGPAGFVGGACVAVLGSLLLGLLLLLALELPPGLIVAGAWNPVLPLFASGEAHNDILMAPLLLAALLLLARGRPAGALVAATLAVLVKPFAVVVVVPVLVAAGWRRAWLVPALVLAAYLPFLGEGSAPFESLRAFFGDFHYHGALEPGVRLLLRPLLVGEQLGVAVRGVLVLLLAGGWLLLWRLRGAATPATLAARLLGVLLLCAPTLHPWYFIALVVLLPFARSWALAAWTALAPLYWLHGEAMLAAGAWVESPWVTAGAHLPVVVLMLVEAAGPRREPPEWGRRPWSRPVRAA